MKDNKYWPLIKSVCACIIGAGFGSLSFQLILAAYVVISDAVPFSEAFSFLLPSESIAAVFFVVFAFIFFPMLIIGLPVQYYLQQYNKTNLLVHAIPAAIAGTALPLLSVWLMAYIPLCGTVGFISGTVAWLIRRPDKDAPKTLPLN